MSQLVKRKKQARKITKKTDGRFNLNKAGMGNLKMFIQNRRLVLPDMFQTRVLYATGQALIFNTAASTGAISWGMNDLNSFRVGTSPTPISGLTSSGGVVISDAARYKKYRIQSVKFKVRLQSREAVSPQTYALHPSSTLPATNTSLEFAWLMMQQSCCVRTVGALSSGNAYTELSMDYNPEKLIGEHYHQQDEYAGTILGSFGSATFGAPATPVYMGLSFHNVNVNTMTTGGAVMTVQAFINVLFYEVDRDEDPAVFHSPSDPDGLEALELQISTLELRAKQLARQASK